MIRRRLPTLFALAAFVAGAAMIAPASASTSVAASTAGAAHVVAGPAVSMVGDSLAWIPPVLVPAALRATGWSSVALDAYPGRGVTDIVAGHPDGLGAVDAIREGPGDTEYWIVALGTNDARLHPAADQSRLIRAMLDRIGTDKRVLWVNIFLPRSPAKQQAFNAALDTIAAGRIGVTVFDWAALAAQHPDWLGPDGVHQTLAGTIARADAIASASLSMLGASRPIDVDPVEVLTADGAALAGLVPVGPQRVLDTRIAATRTMVGGTTTVELAALVPAGTAAVAVNVTAVGATRGGFATAYPCDQPKPASSTVNFEGASVSAGGGAQSAAAIVAVSATATLCVFTSTAAHLVVDVSAAFVAGGGVGMDPVEPQRILDTRLGADGRVGGGGVLPAGTTTRIGTPAGDGAVMVNLTVDRATAPGFLTAWPCAQPARPVVSNLNYITGEGSRANASIVPVGADGQLCVFNSAPVAIVVDLFAVFGSERGHRLQPTIPTRVLDTRDGDGGWAGRLAPEQPIVVTVAGAPAGAIVVGTLTVAGTTGPGYVTAWDGAGSRPPTSNLNFVAGTVRPNLILVATSADADPSASATVTLTNGAPGREQLILDVTGWFVTGE